MTVLVSDTFTDVDGTSLDAHVPDVRPGSVMWQELFTNWTVTSGQARTNTGYRDHAVIDTGQADCEISVDAATYWGDPGSLFGAGLVARWVNQDNHWRININQVDNAVYIVERNGAVDTQRASGAVAIDLGVEYRVKAGLNGQTIEAFVNGVSITSYANATLGQTSTRHGLYICRTSNDGSHCDNFLAETPGGGGATVTGAAGMTGAGNLAGGGLAQAPGGASLAGSGRLDGAALVQAPGGASLTGRGSIEGTVLLYAMGHASVSGSGSLAGAGLAQALGAADLRGDGALAASGFGAVLGRADLRGDGALNARGDVLANVVFGAASLGGSGELSGAGQVMVIGAAGLPAGGSLAGAALAVVPGAALLDALGALQGEPVALVLGEAALEGLGALTASGGVPVETSTPIERVYCIPGDSRVYLIAMDGRVYMVAEDWQRVIGVD